MKLYCFKLWYDKLNWNDLATVHCHRINPQTCRGGCIKRRGKALFSQRLNFLLDTWKGWNFSLNKLFISDQLTLALAQQRVCQDTVFPHRTICRLSISSSMYKHVYIHCACSSLSIPVILNPEDYTLPLGANYVLSSIPCLLPLQWTILWIRPGQHLFFCILMVDKLTKANFYCYSSTGTRALLYMCIYVMCL